MATAEPLLDDIRNELECPICVEERRLHLLPCAHRLCSVCIDALADENSKLLCPACRRSAQVPNHGFPVCVLTEHLRDILSKAGGTIPAGPLSEEETATEGSSERSTARRLVRQLSNLRTRQQSLLHSRTEGAELDLTEGETFNTPVDEPSVIELHRHSSTEEIQHRPEGLQPTAPPLESETAADQPDQPDQPSHQLNPVCDKNTFDHVSAQPSTQREEPTAPPLHEEIPIDLTLDHSKRGQRNSNKPAKAHKQQAKSQHDAENSTGILPYISGWKADSQVISVAHHSANSNIFLGCYDGSKVFSRTTRLVEDLTSHPGTTLVEHQGELFISCDSDDNSSIKVFRYNIQNRESTLLYSFPMLSELTSSLSVSENYIASLDKDSEAIKFYDRRLQEMGNDQCCGFFINLFSKQPPELETIALPEFTYMRNICFFSADDLLVSGWDVSYEQVTVNKYTVQRSESGELLVTYVWSCDQVPDACGMAVENGFIFVSGMENKTIYILSAEGVKLAECTHEDLPRFYENISVKNGELAVAGWTDKKLLLFKIQWVGLLGSRC